MPVLFPAANFRLRMVAPKPTASQPSGQPVSTDKRAVANTPSWKHEQANAVRDPEELLQLLELDPGLLPAAKAASKAFPLRVPRSFIARMRKGDPDDPLLRQILPLDAELQEIPGYDSDPLQEAGARLASGLLQKYAGRALLTVTGACGVHCRYCFRRHFPYAEENPRRDWPQVLERLREDASIGEIILSGGDPLLLDTTRLREISADLAEIPHIRRLRIHSRQPVVLPARVDAELLTWLRELPFQKVLVIHANHPAEISPNVRHAMQAVQATGVTLLNQSVLLRGVNDNAEVLAELSEALFAAGVLPYYLHVLDKVAGAAHFDLPETRARNLWRDLHTRLPGYLVPTLVREEPDKPGKTPLYR